jgi:UDP-N-acetylmuramoylalanine--D-glutamate ligase
VITSAAKDLSASRDLTVVVGLGRSGIGAAKLLHQLGHSVVLLESKSSQELENKAKDLRSAGITVQLAAPLAPATFAGLLQQPKTVVVSPGIPWDHPTLCALRQDGIVVRGELAAAWDSCQQVPWIGITGTNGKTTVTHLVSHLLTSAGIDAPMGGNVGHSAAELVLERMQPGQVLPNWMVVELSSYQIEAASELAPQIGIWTTLTPDHLERHGTLENYRAIKRSLLERSHVRILNGDDPDLRAHGHTWDHALWITAGPGDDLPNAIKPFLWIEGNQVMQQGPGGPAALMAADALAMPGAHNRQNMLLAAAAGLQAGLSGSQLEAGFRQFSGVPHRLERICDYQGVAFVNDSKATNYDAAEVALKALEGPLVVLAGGESKRGDARGWIQALTNQAKAVVLYGAAQAELADLLADGGYPGRVLCCEGLVKAVSEAAELARSLQCKAVLLSPACASFDQYSDFEARGDHFRQLVRALAAGAPTQGPGSPVPA